MAATQSARAKARMASLAAPKSHVRSRSGLAAPTSTANLGWTMSGAHAPPQRAGQSPESSCSVDRTPPALGGRSRLASA
uniref:Uncharacterized protein n=1 Tax=Arundo donax TaxID=35708 RepID=A0A0A9AN86_ARUDO